VNLGIARASLLIPMVETLLTKGEMKMELCVRSLSYRGLSRFFTHLSGCRGAIRVLSKSGVIADIPGSAISDRVYRRDDRTLAAGTKNRGLYG
jgi:hypothetical protein